MAEQETYEVILSGKYGAGKHMIVDYEDREKLCHLKLQFYILIQNTF